MQIEENNAISRYKKIQLSCALWPKPYNITEAELLDKDSSGLIKIGI